MKDIGLSEKEVALIHAALSCHKSISSATLFGSRAKGNASPQSDIDIALRGVDDPLEAQAIASELEALPMPYRFDILTIESIKHRPLLEHIERVGVTLYQQTDAM